VFTLGNLNPIDYLFSLKSIHVSRYKLSPPS
jgi:hypothetical protein